MRDFKTPRHPSPPRGLRRVLAVRSHLSRGRRRRQTALPKGFKPLTVPPQQPLPKVPGAAPARPRLPRPGQWSLGTLANGVYALGVGWLVLGVLLALPGLWSGPVQSVRVTGARTLSAQEVPALAGMRPGMPMSQADPFLLTRLLDQVPRIEAADVRRVLPGRVWIDLRERQPELRVALGGGQQALIDRYNVVMALGPQPGWAGTGLPLVMGAQAAPSVGQALEDPALQPARDLLLQARQAGLDAAAPPIVDVRGTQALALVRPDGQRLLLSPGHALDGLRVFAALQAQDPALLQGGSTVDLRFVDDAPAPRVYLEH